jgi:hypothetical protein
LNLAKCIAKRSGVVIAQVRGSGHNHAGNCCDQLPGLVKVAFSAVGCQSALNRSHA